VSIRSGLVIGIAAIGFLGMGLSSTAAAQGACPAGSKISKQIAKPMIAAQEAMKKRNWQDMLTKVREAESTPGGKSAFDLYNMAEFRGYAYHNLHQDADAAREMELGLNSPCMAESKKFERYKSLAGLYFALRNYPKAIDYSNRALKVQRDPEVQVTLGQSYYLSGNNKEAARVMKELLAQFEQGNRKPPEQQLLLVRSACDRAGDNSCVAQVLEKLVIYYPKPEYWEHLMKAINRLDTDDVQKLNAMRLAVHVNVLKKPEDYKEMAQLTLERNLGCEAQAVLEDGFAKKVFVEKRDVDVNQRLLATAKAQCAKEKGEIATADAAARAAKTGDADAALGAQYLGFGDSAKAVEALQRSVTKGVTAEDVAKDKQGEKVDEAYMVLGLAHLRNNNKTEARKAFNLVKRDPTMVRIAKLWNLNT